MRELQYPIGEYSPPDTISETQVQTWIDDIEQLPPDLRAVVEPLTSEQLNVPYRPEGWTARQVVHHVADSHLNSLVRFKWALTEDRPTIKAYDEVRWAELPDYAPTVPVDVSLDFLDVLHRRWVRLLRGMTAGQFDREFVHPDLGAVSLRWNLGNYAWHGRHHLAHIARLVDRRGWMTASAKQ